MTVSMIFMVIAMICFFLAIVDWPTGSQVRLIAAGLLAWVISILISTAGR
jgi:hypothetical protein